MSQAVNFFRSEICFCVATRRLKEVLSLIVLTTAVVFDFSSIPGTTVTLNIAFCVSRRARGHRLHAKQKKYA